jgi:hypothetical protein
MIYIADEMTTDSYCERPWLMDTSTKNRARKYILDSSIFCPNCGVKTVYVEDHPGDVYEGPLHVCTACNCSFTMPSYPSDYEAKNTDIFFPKLP